MNKSETIGKLADALSKFQGEMPAVEMNAKNPFLKNKYADLGAIIKTSKPILAKHGLAVSQLSTSNERKIGVETILMHSSGEYISQSMELDIEAEKGLSLAQVAGKIITYLRRYGMTSILGLYADEDVDGNDDKTERKPENKPAAKAEQSKGVGRFDNVGGVKLAIEKKQAEYEKKAVPVKPGMIGVMVGKLDELCGGENQRHRFLNFVTGEGSSKKMDDYFAPAILDWCKDEESAKVEARAIIAHMDAQAGLLDELGFQE